MLGFVDDTSFVVWTQNQATLVPNLKTLEKSAPSLIYRIYSCWMRARARILTYSSLRRISTHTLRLTYNYYKRGNDCKTPNFSQICSSSVQKSHQQTQLYTPKVWRQMHFYKKKNVDTNHPNKRGANHLPKTTKAFVKLCFSSVYPVFPQVFIVFIVFITFSAKTELGLQLSSKIWIYSKKPARNWGKNIWSCHLSYSQFLQEFQLFPSLLTHLPFKSLKY